jgi:hypothetical protein
VTDYRVVCVTQQYPTAHKHITSAGTGTTSPIPAKRWTVEEVRAAMAAGDRFYTYTDGATTALVEPFTCGCGYGTIRSAADATLANNLDRLRDCP